jgi:tetratricopeptide (TPR) repeat protein
MNRGRSDMVDRVFKAGSTALLLFLLAAFTGCSSVNEHLAMKEGAKLYKAQQYLDAAKKFEEAQALNATRAETFRNIGYCYWSLIEPGSTQAKDLEYTDKALDAFSKYLATNPPDGDKIQDYLINLYVNSNHLDQGIAYYEGFLQKNPNDARILQTLALLYGKKGDFAKSLEYSSRKADMTPTDAAGYVFIGALCWQRSYNKVDEPQPRMEIVDKGLGALDKALSINKESFEGLLYKNLLLRQKSDVTKMFADAERKDKKKKKALEEEAAGYITQAEELRKQAIEVKKKQTQQPQAAPAAPAQK